MKAELADNTAPGLPVATPDVLIAVLADFEIEGPGLIVKQGRKEVCGWALLQAGLLRQACGLTFSEIALRTGISTSQAHVRCEQHQRQVLADDEYASISCHALRQAAGALQVPSA
jgi:hypothetical protein